MAQISFIMPAYNAENSCSKAIESVLNQKYLDLELIVVDDGSSDQTLEICKKYEEKYQNITVIHQENCGVSAARNRGIKLASAPYIGFIDSDDCLSDNFGVEISRVLQNQKPDMLLFGYDCVEQGSVKSTWVPISSVRYDEIVYRLLECSGGLNPLWNKIFKRDIILTEFNIQKSMGEDMEFVCNFLTNAASIVSIPQPLYRYNTDTDNSLTKNMDLVLHSVLTDFAVLQKFTSEVQIGEELLADRCIQRIEGILGKITTYKQLKNCCGAFERMQGFRAFLEKCHPIKKKNVLLKNLIYRKKVLLVYVYLSVKRCLRKFKSN